MPESPTPVKWDLFPIRLSFIHLKKVSFEACRLPEELTSEELATSGAGGWNAGVTVSVQESSATVEATVHQKDAEGEACKDDSPQRPYLLSVTAIASFSFDPEQMKRQEVETWCRVGSFFIIAPYIRNLISEITRDSGFPSVYLPMLVLPTFRAPPMKDSDKAMPQKTS
jgi:preprotein translocase subunit SecB